MIADSHLGSNRISKESFSDYENRLPRGRSYVRNGSVVHLEIEQGGIKALVQGSSLYKVAITIKHLKPEKWDGVLNRCSGQIASMIELLQGRLSSGVMNTIVDKHQGLFPSPKEISFDCSCPDWAQMCKHVAAALYGVGNRLDHEPELLFKLRKVDHMELINTAHLKAPASSSAKSNVIKGENLSEIFGIDIAGRSVEAPRAKIAVKRGKKNRKTKPRRGK